MQGLLDSKTLLRQSMIGSGITAGCVDVPILSKEATPLVYLAGNQLLLTSDKRINN
jgi:hypothetical protein